MLVDALLFTYDAFEVTKDTVPCRRTEKERVSKNNFLEQGHLLG